MNKSIAIIGSGIGGLVSALYLAKYGYQVNIFEKNEIFGGKVGEIRENGFRFDTGPSILTMAFVFEELFDFIGENISEYLTLEEVSPITRYFWDDGTQIDTFKEINLMENELSKINIDDAKKYKSFLDYSKQIYDFSKEVFIFNSITDPKIIFNFHNLIKLFSINKLDPFNTISSSIDKQFKTEKIRQIFKRFATYNGSNPYIAPATLNVISYVELGLGVYYIKGGIFKLAQTLYDLSIKFGVKFHFNKKVNKILVQGQKVIGIETNKKENFDFIISNIDAVGTSKIIENDKKLINTYSKMEPSLSGMVFLWGINKKLDNLIHHNIFFANDYQEEFEYIHSKKTIYHDPTIYIAITSKSDIEDAPQDCENLFVLINQPFMNNQDWEKNKELVKKYVLEKLKKNNIDIEKNIIFEKIISPEDMQNIHGSNKGSIYGIASNNKYTAFLRPQNKNRFYKNLYMVGGSSHPGGGLPMVTLSGKITSKLINEAGKK